jgi:cellulose synthase/poly-beta-1,6-N-acetylglucosamine synthase-like glycosyltransferase
MIGIFPFVIYILSFLFICLLQITGLIYALSSLFYRSPKLVKLTENPKVAVIVACRNEREVVIKTIKHLLNLYYKNKEIIIGDDSNNGTYEMMLNEFGLKPKFYKKTKEDGEIFIAKNDKITIIHRKNNFGFKAGNLKICHDYIEENNIPFYALFDADWLPDLNFIEKILPYFYTYKNAGCVQFKRLLPNRVTSFFTKVTSMSPETAYNVDLPGRANLKTFVLFCGSAGIFRMKAVTDAGGWRPGDLTEDIDLSLRLYLKGYKIYFDKNTKSYGEETPNRFSDFMRQQARWQRGTIDSTKKYLLSAIASKKLSLNEKWGVIYQSFIFFPYFLVLLFIFFNILMDILSILGILPASLYISFGITGKYLYWLAFIIFFFDMFKIGLSNMKKRNKKNIFLIPFTILFYWALIPSGFIANMKSILNIKEGWFLTPKSKNVKRKKKYYYKIFYVFLFLLLTMFYIYEIFFMGYTPNWYHILLPLSLLVGIIFK